MRVAVTGSSGRVGAAVVARLAVEHEVVGIDKVAGNFTRIVGDIADAALVQRALQGADAVVHMAALHAPHVATHSREEFFRTNVQGTENVLDAARIHKVGKIVYTSTTSVYGDAMISSDRAIWVTEDMFPRPRDVYDETKLIAEECCERHAQETGASVTALRMSRCFPESDQLIAIYRLYRGVELSDVAEAHALALARKGKYGVFNISAQSLFAVNETEDLVRNADSVILRHVPEAAEVFARRGWKLPRTIDRVYVIEKARRELGYQPKVNFRELLAQMAVP